MPFGLCRRKPFVGSVNSNPISEKYCCMVLRLNIDCNSCCRKLRRIVLRMKEIETHMIEKQERRLIVCGRFVPADVAIKIRKKMNRRVEILEIEEFSGEYDQNVNEQEQPVERPPNPYPNPTPMVIYPGQVMPLA